MMAINNLDSLKKLLPKVMMVKSKRDGRLGSILKIKNGNVILKMENVERTLSLDFITVQEGFVFIFSKREAVCDWYHIKHQRGLVPRLNTQYSVYISMLTIYDDLNELYPELSNHQIFVILDNLRKLFNK